MRNPNVIIIYMDDLAWGDLASHGNPYTRTPNLDKLRGQSTRLTRYCSGPLCTPARASLMTGRYPYRTRAIDTYCGRSMLDPDEVTLPQILRDAGYLTGIFGKWHLGDNYPMRACDRGFEESLVHAGGGLEQPSNPGAAGYFDPDLMHNGRWIATKGYCTDIYTDAACQFIRKQQHEPFFVYLATNAPHSPMIVGEQWWRRFADMGLSEQMAKFYGMVDNIDHNVDKVMSLLDELKLADDTILMFSSDHGPCGSARDQGKTRFNAGLRGEKATLYEGGVRVPCLIRYPKKFKSGQDIDRIANPIDILPTLAHLCGGKLSTDRKIDGADLSPLLLNQSPPQDWPDRTLFMQWHRGDVPILYRNYGVFEQRFKLYRPEENVPDELYDIIADPSESQNIAAKHPDVVSRMRRAYEEWFKEVSSTRGPGNYDPPRIVVGTEHENPLILTRQDWRLLGAPDGWSDTDVGCWEITIGRAGVYRITLDLPTPADPQSPAEVHLQIGDFLINQSVVAGAKNTVIEVPALPAGNVRVSAWLESCGKRFGMRYVRILRITNDKMVN